MTTSRARHRLVLLALLLGVLTFGGYAWLVFQGGSGSRQLTNLGAQLSEWAASTDRTRADWFAAGMPGQSKLGREMLRSIRTIDDQGEPSTDLIAPFAAAVSEWCRGLRECTTSIAAYLPKSSCDIDTAAQAAIAAYVERPARFRDD